MTTASYFTDVHAAFSLQADAERAVAQAAYMRNQFSFWGTGVPAARRIGREISRRYPLGSLNELTVRCAGLWQLDQREFQYVACDELRRHSGLLTPEALVDLSALITAKSWWDTVDELGRHSVGDIVRHFPDTRCVMDDWLASDELWLVRSAILHQERWRADTDFDWLRAACLRHGTHPDFFIRKAIGWSLRSYAHSSAVNAAKVRQFIAEHDSELSGLSKREALKRVIG